MTTLAVVVQMDTSPPQEAQPQEPPPTEMLTDDERMVIMRRSLFRLVQTTDTQPFTVNMQLGYERNPAIHIYFSPFWRKTGNVPFLPKYVSAFCEKHGIPQDSQFTPNFQFQCCAAALHRSMTPMQLSELFMGMRLPGRHVGTNAGLDVIIINKEAEEALSGIRNFFQLSTTKWNVSRLGIDRDKLYLVVHFSNEVQRHQVEVIIGDKPDALEDWGASNFKLPIYASDLRLQTDEHPVVQND